MKSSLNYLGIYGNNSERPAGICMESIAKTSKLYDWKIKPHLHHDLFQFFIIKEGSGTLLLGAETKSFEGPCFFIIPKNTLHGFEFNPDIRGRVITIPDLYLEQLFREDYRIFELVDRVHLWPLDLAKAIDKSIFDLLIHCDWEYATDLPGKELLVQTYIVQLFIFISRLPALEAIPGHEKLTDRASLRFFREFLQLIRTEEAPSRKSIGAYAAMINISSNRLNRICNVIAGKSSKDILSEYVLNEAKTLLKTSVQTISEISYQLHFESPAYFTRFFKNKTGYSPSEFKLQQGK